MSAGESRAPCTHECLRLDAGKSVAGRGVVAPYAAWHLCACLLVHLRATRSPSASLQLASAEPVLRREAGSMAEPEDKRASMLAMQLPASHKKSQAQYAQPCTASAAVEAPGAALQLRAGASALGRKLTRMLTWALSLSKSRLTGYKNGIKGLRAARQNFRRTCNRIIDPFRAGQVKVEAIRNSEECEKFATHFCDR